MSDGKKDNIRMRALLLGLLVSGSVVIFMLGVMVSTHVQVPPEAVRGGPPGKASPGAPAPVAVGGPPAREEVPLPQKGVEVKSEEMTFYDTLAKSESQPAPPAQPAPAPAALPQPPAAVLAGKEPSSVEAPAAEKEAPPVKPAVAAQAASEAPEKMKIAAGGKFAIQVMATKDPKEAEATAAKLAKGGWTAYVSPAAGARGKLYRVRVGRMATEEEARGIGAELRAKTRYKDAYLVKE